MGPSLCRSCLASLLKFLNFLQAFVGVSIILYSAWILNHLRRNEPGNGFDFDFDVDKLPAVWFVCALMGLGILVCLIAFAGHVAAETISGCCLCFYTMLTMMLILLEAVLAVDIVFNKHWQEDLPNDSTGELNRLRAFIESNIDMCKWVALTVIIIQVLSLLLAMILRCMVPRGRLNYDSDEDFVVIRRPLLHPQGGSTFTSTIDGKAYQSDIWSSRIREKYGLNQNQNHLPLY